MKLRIAIVGAGLWMVAAGAAAISLGASRGVAVLGAPVDLSFDVLPDPGTEVAASCISARLMAGDTPISDAKVRVVPLPEMRGRPSGVRVLANVPVDEPVLTVTLTAGCMGKVTRSYVFLSELPSALARTNAPVDVARLSALSGGSGDAPRPAQGARPAGRGSAPAAQAPAVQQEPTAAAASGTRAAVPQRAARSTPRPAAAAAPKAPTKVAAKTDGRPRLVVEPLDDLWLDRPVALRTSPELLITPSEEASAQRAQAAALWKSLNAQPEDLAQDADRLKALESDIASLRTQSEQDRANAVQVRQQLEQALEERFSATVVYALGGLLLLALLALAFLSRKRGQGADRLPAWRDSVAAVGGLEELAEHAQTLGLTPHPSDTWVPSENAPAPAAEQPPAVPAPQLLPAGADMAAPRAPAFVTTVPAPSGPVPLAAQVPAAAYPPAPLHIVSPEELFDIQQQAEFFVSVGEHQQAIAVLKNHIAERGDVSPLAYLELLRLYHTLSRSDEFAQLRTQFMQSFNAQVPEFSVFHRTGRMLYHYTDALAEIEAVWTSPTVLPLLERLLFRRDDSETAERFDLAAYDELLLLLAIAQTTPPSARGQPAPRKRTTPLAPERADAVVMRTESPTSAVDALGGQVAAHSQEPITSPLDLDLDLDFADPPHVTLSDLPPVPVTPPPPPGQPVGFGMNNDLMELRLELQEQEPPKRRI